MHKEMTEEAKKLSFAAEIVTAETSTDALQKAQSSLFHAISLDQKMPRHTGEQADSDSGREMMLTVADLELSSYICVYTLFPNIEISNVAGSKGAIPYKVKATDSSVDDEGVARMDAVDYCEFFVPEAFQKFILRAFDRMSIAGLPNLRSLSINCRDTYEEFLAGGFIHDAHAKSFFDEFGKFREAFNRSLSCVIRGIASSKSLKLDTLSKKATAKNVEDWICKSWKALESDSNFDEICNGLSVYFGLDEKVSFADYFVDACRELREPRNTAVHQDWSFTPEEFSRLRGSFLRFTEVVAFFASLPLIVQPRRTSGETISFMNVNFSRPREQSVTRSGLIIPDVNPARVFAVLPGVKGLVPLDGGIISRRDEANRLVVEEVGLR